MNYLTISWTKKSTEEFRDYLSKDFNKSISVRRSNDNARSLKRKRAALPASKDWRSLGKVNDIKDQGICGKANSVFSAISSLESAFAITNGNLWGFNYVQVICFLIKIFYLKEYYLIYLSRIWLIVHMILICAILFLMMALLLMNGIT